VSQDFLAGEVVQAGSRYAPSNFSPQDLREYEAIQPGFTNRMLTLAERETEHRMTQEAAQDEATIRLAARGQMLAFVIVMTLVLGGIAAILTNHSIVGFAAVITAAAALAAAFVGPAILGRWSEGRRDGGPGSALSKSPGAAEYQSPDE
jgi:uncharacterized membrane protein